MKKLLLSLILAWMAVLAYAQTSELENQARTSTFYQEFIRISDLGNPDSLLLYHAELAQAMDTAGQNTAEQILYAQASIAREFTLAQMMQMSDSMLFDAQKNYLLKGYDTLVYAYGAVYQVMGINSNYLDKQRCFQDVNKMANIFSKLGDPFLNATSLIELANNMPKLESINQKLIILDSAISICDRHNFYLYGGISLALKGEYISNYDPLFAKEVLKQALKMLQKAERPNLGMMAVVYGMLATTFNNLGDEYKDEQFYWYKKNEDLFAVDGLNHAPRKLELYLNLFDAYMRFKDFDNAERCMDSTAQIFHTQLDSTHLYYPEFLFRQGRYHIKKKEFEAALPYMEDAMKGYVAWGNYLMVQNVRDALAEIAYEQSEPYKALAYLNEVLFESMDQPLPQNQLDAPLIPSIEEGFVSVIPNALKNKIILLRQMYEKKPSDTLLQAITNHYQGFIEYNERYMVSALSMEETMINYSKELDLLTHEMLEFYAEIDLSDKDTKMLWEMVSTNKANQLYIQKLKAKETKNASKQEIAKQKLYREILDIDTQLQQIKDSSSAEFISIRDQWFEKNQELLVMQMRSDENSSEAQMHQSAQVSPTELQKAMPESAILLDYYYYDSVVYIFDVSKNGVFLAHNQLNVDLGKEVNTLFRKIKTGDMANMPANHILYDALLKPVKSNISAKDKLVVIPDKMLFLLPFDLLPSPGNEGKMLIETHDIVYNYSPVFYYESLKEQHLNDESIFILSPGFDGGDDGALASRSPFRDLPLDDMDVFAADEAHLMPLPFAVEEAQAINQLFQDFGIISDLRIKQDATEKAFRDNASKYGIYHFATHGVAVKSQPWRTGVFLSQNGDGNYDGFLQMSELYNLDIHASLVVLSACKTGYGSITDGEGIIALPRGFLFAGANNILASLWKIHDEHTKEFMLNFYRYVLEGDSYASALRKAKLSAIEKNLLPMDWSGFVLIGH